MPTGSDAQTLLGPNGEPLPPSTQRLNELVELALSPNVIGPLQIAAQLGISGWGPHYSPQLIERVGTANRCLQLVCQQVCTLPLRYRHSLNTQGFEPLWVSNPDPVWFPNGIRDAMFAALWSVYAWGDMFLWVTDRYESGYPRSWTVVDPAMVTVEADPAGGRLYRVQGQYLYSEDVLQVSRDPRGRLRGTPALAAYASNLIAASAAENFAADFYTAGGVPWAVLQPQRRLTADQAVELQDQWIARTTARGAAPAVIPPDVAFQQFSFNPKDLMLLESREWDAKQIAAAFGVPAWMLNMEQAGGLNYSSPVMMFRTWWQTELYPTAHAIETALSRWLPRGNWVEFDPSVLLRPNVAELADVAVKVVGAEILTATEARAMLFDLPPLSEGEALDLIDVPSGSRTSEADVGTVPAAPAQMEGVVA